MDAVLSIALSREVFDAIEAGTSGVPRLVIDVSYLEDARPAAERKTGTPDVVPRSLRVQMTAPGVLQIDVGSPLELGARAIDPQQRWWCELDARLGSQRRQGGICNNQSRR